MAFNLDGYIDVAERLNIFREKYPEGSLQPANPERPLWVEVIDGQAFVVYAAAAYRSPTDPRPGMGIAWEPVPGKTPYTKDSEAMNAETSAWGRAIVAALAADTKKIASAEEVRNRAGDEVPGSTGAAKSPARLASPKQRFALERLIEVHGPPDGCAWPLDDDLTMRAASGFIDTLKKLPEVKNQRVSTLRPVEDVTSEEVF